LIGADRSAKKILEEKKKNNEGGKKDPKVDGKGGSLVK